MILEWKDKEAGKRRISAGGKLPNISGILGEP